MKNNTQELNDPKYRMAEKNLLKISKNVRNPSDNGRKASVHLRKSSVIFGNFRNSSGNRRLF